MAPALRALTENPSMVSLDPPDHTRLRRIVNKAFTPRQIKGLRPRIEAIVDRLLDRVDGRFELMADLARPLPVEVICEMLAVPEGDRPFIRDRSADLTYLFELVTSVEKRQTGFRGWSALTTYFEELAAERSGKPGADLLSMLLVVEEAGDRLTRSEVVSMANLLLFGGHDTTINLIGNGVLALLRHPHELARLREDPSIVESAVEEVRPTAIPTSSLTPIASISVAWTTGTWRSAADHTSASARRWPASRGPFWCPNSSTGSRALGSPESRKGATRRPFAGCRHSCSPPKAEEEAGPRQRAGKTHSSDLIQIEHEMSSRLTARSVKLGERGR